MLSYRKKRRLHYHLEGNRTLEKFQLEIEKLNELFKKYTNGQKLTELKDLIYVESELVGDKIDIPQRKPNRNTKAWWETRRVG